MALLVFHGIGSFAINFVSMSLQLSHLIAHWIWNRWRTGLIVAIGLSYKTRAPNLPTELPATEPGDTNDRAVERAPTHPYPIPIGILKIRLLELYSGKPNEPLRGYLRILEFDKRRGDQPYEALSYAWGHVDRRRSMILNNKPFPITESLHQALQHLRSEVADRTIWIDAICINQNDKAERSKQVSIMGDIYKCARGVVNWLGVETTDTAVGMDVLSYLFGNEDLTAGRPWETFKPEKLCAGLNDILNRDYFERMWVVQENALAAKITLQVGNRTIAWHCGPETYRAICRIKFAVISPPWDAAGLDKVNFRPLLEILEQSMMITRQEMGKSCREVTLLDQVFDMRYRKATDRRDLLFALRSMVPEHIKERIPVDYERPVNELYADLFEEVKKAYMNEMLFVEEFEKERLERMMKQEQEATRRYGGGW